MASQSPQVMDLTSLRAVLADLRARLLPSRFEKAQQPDPQTLQLGFRTLRGMIWLALSWKAEVPRLVEISAHEVSGLLAHDDILKPGQGCSCRGAKYNVPGSTQVGPGVLATHHHVVNAGK